MTEPTIICPNCKTEIKLTESLAAPLIESIRRQYEQRIAEKNAEVAKHELSLREREEALSKARESLEDQVAKKVRAERAKIVQKKPRRLGSHCRPILSRRPRTSPTFRSS